MDRNVSLNFAPHHLLLFALFFILCAPVFEDCLLRVVIDYLMLLVLLNIRGLFVMCLFYEKAQLKGGESIVVRFKKVAAVVCATNLFRTIYESPLSCR